MVDRRARDRLFAAANHGAGAVVPPGAYGSGAYVDPFAQPLEFLRLAGPRLVALLFGLFGAAPIDLLALLDPHWLPWLTALACAFLLVVGWLLAPLVRAAREGLARVE